MAIKIVQYFELTAFTSVKAARSLANIDQADGIVQKGDTGAVVHRYQNFFINQQIKRGNKRFDFAPFKMEGTSSVLGGDNSLVQVLFPNVEVALRLVEQGNGNRLSRLGLTTVWLNENNEPTGKAIEERFLGLGASFSETTIELRFKSAMDSVGGRFPARALSRNLVGILPLNSDLRLQ
jgi:hypothetical protein